MKKSELIFGSLRDNVSFIESIKYLSNLSENELLSIQKAYLESKYRYYYHDHPDKFLEITDLSFKEAHGLFHLIDLLSYRIIPNHSVQDIILAMNELISEKVNNLGGFLKRFKSKATQEVLKNLDLIDDEIGSTNPHFGFVSYTIQNRMIFKNNKIIERLPIVLLKIETSKDDNFDVIEFLEDDIDSLVEELSEIKKKLSMLKEGDKNENIIDN